jgi:eukaryotic-like serine/threonine-protein kinase
MTLSGGHKLGPYEIVEPIGAGGMGQVYRARDPRMGREVAIKVSAEQFSERFDREVRAVASLNHVNICTLHDVGPNYLVMELVEGPTLADRTQQGAIPLEEALGIGRQISDALEAAHEKGIIHRDLKPANVKLKLDGTVKVLDFGLAKVADTQSGGRVTESPTLTIGATQPGVIVGTAAYMAPEQARARTVDKRADIWAFGVVLFEMLTGRRLFQGEDVSETLAAVIKEEPDWSLVPAQVRRLLKSCLARDPRRRLRDIGDVWQLLDDAPQAIHAVTQPWPSLLPWIAAAVFAILAVVAFWAPWRTPAAAPRLMRLQIPVPGNATPGLFAVSPDGQSLAFIATGTDGIRRLWLRRLDSLEAQPLRGTEGLSTPTPFWSPDSRFIAFDAGGTLKKIDVSGGPPQRICDLSNAAIGGAWNSDGVILFGSLGGGIQRVSEGGVAIPITSLDTSRNENRHVLPILLPDGRHFLYLRVSSAIENSAIYLGSIDSPPAGQNAKPLLITTIAPGFAPAPDLRSGSLLFIRNQTLMSQPFDIRQLQLVGDPSSVADGVGSAINGGFFSASNNGVLVYRTGPAGRGQTWQLTWFDSQGKKIGAAWEPFSFTGSGFAIAPDGFRGAVSRVDTQTANPDLWILDFVRNTPTRFTFGSGISGNPIWSPAGNRVIFTSNHDGGFNLYQKPANLVKDVELLLKSPEMKTPTSWSRDGRFVLYTAIDPKRKDDVWVLPLEGERKPVPLITSPFNESEARFSPDGHFIAYVSDDSGRSEVYVRPFSGTSVGERWQVSNNGGTDPRWRGDGRAIFYMTPDGTVMQVDVKTGATFQSEAARALFKLPPGSTPPDVTGDGKRFLAGVPTDQDAQTPFTVITNWQSALKR